METAAPPAVAAPPAADPTAVAAPPAAVAAPPAAVAAPPAAIIHAAADPPAPSRGWSGRSDRDAENVAADELTPAEIDALFATQENPPARRKPAAAGSTAVMGETDMDDLLRSLGEDPKTQCAWLPKWAATPKNPADVYAWADEVCNEEVDRQPESLQILRGLENTAATIDDTTVATRDKVSDLTEEVKTLQAQVEGVDDSLSVVKAQNAALTEGVRELRLAVMTMRSHLAALIRQEAGGRPAGGPAAVAGPDGKKAGEA